MKFEGQLESRDYLAANYLHVRPRLVFRWIGILLILLALFVAGSLLLRQGEEPGFTWTPYVILFPIIYLAISYGILLPIRTRKIFRQQKTLRDPFEAEVTEEGIHSKSSIGETRMPWGDFHKWKASRKLILLYHSDVMFQIFPSRLFGEEQFEEFEKLVREKLGPPSA